MPKLPSHITAKVTGAGTCQLRCQCGESEWIKQVWTAPLSLETIEVFRELHELCSTTLETVLEGIYRGYCWAVNYDRPMDVTWYVDGGHFIEGLIQKRRRKLA